MEPSIPHTSTDQQQVPQSVPPELLKLLHDANLRFHETKQNLEAALSDTSFRQQERTAEAASQIRQAEQQVEDAEAKIREFLQVHAHPVK